ncbi:hypothetical protein MRX96_056280 [Rhipicephalus microplus]
MATDDYWDTLRPYASIGEFGRCVAEAERAPPFPVTYRLRPAALSHEVSVLFAEESGKKGKLNVIHWHTPYTGDGFSMGKNATARRMFRQQWLQDPNLKDWVAPSVKGDNIRAVQDSFL